MNFQAADSFDPKIWLVIAGAAALAVVPGLLSGRKTFFAGFEPMAKPKVGRVRRLKLDSGGYLRGSRGRDYRGSTDENIYAADIEYQIISGPYGNEPFIEKETTIEVRARDPKEAKRMIQEIANKKHGKHGGL